MQGTEFSKCEQVPAKPAPQSSQFKTEIPKSRQPQNEPVKLFDIKVPMQSEPSVQSEDDITNLEQAKELIQVLENQVTRSASVIKELAAVLDDMEQLIILARIRLAEAENINK